jgi:hypothetical protein
MLKIKCLGYKNRKLFSVYQCGRCFIPFKCAETNVRSGNTTQCDSCAKIQRAESRRLWSFEKLEFEAKKYQTKKQFKAESPRAYSAARRAGLIKGICCHMHPASQKWRNDEIICEAKKYKTRDSFMRGSGGAYVAARSLGIIDKACAHMGKSDYTSDKNVFYIWRVQDGGADTCLYKVGVSSEKCWKRRIRDVSLAYGFGARLICSVKTIEADSLERLFLEAGAKIEMPKGNGHSEFRIFAWHDLCMLILEQMGGRGHSVDLTGLDDASFTV